MKFPSDLQMLKHSLPRSSQSNHWKTCEMKIQVITHKSNSKVVTVRVSDCHIVIANKIIIIISIRRFTFWYAWILCYELYFWGDLISED